MTEPESTTEHLSCYEQVLREIRREMESSASTGLDRVIPDIFINGIPEVETPSGNGIHARSFSVQEDCTTSKEISARFSQPRRKSLASLSRPTSPSKEKTAIKVSNRLELKTSTDKKNGPMSTAK